jgi:sec-independent protein translocase protein TatA
VIILVMLLFGRGRVSGLMGELGKGLKSFKQGISEHDEERFRTYSEQRPAELGEDRSGQPQTPDAANAQAAMTSSPRDHRAGL